jgi:uncharacterized protein
LIHKYRLGEFNIVVDVNSGSVHVVDNVTYDLLDLCGDCDFTEPRHESLDSLIRNHGEKEVQGAMSEIRFLINARKLFTPDPVPEKFKSSIQMPIKAMCLNISHDCQLRCKYCFASHGNFGGSRALMSFEIASGAIDFLIKNSGARRNLEIDFFGGEPLMNFGVIEKTVIYAKKMGKTYGKNFRFTLTTNGVALDDEKIDFINSEMSNVVMSLDGRKSINDSMRVNSLGHGCYESIINKFKKLINKRKNKDYYIRGTFTKKNLDFSKDLFSIYNLGFSKISIEPAVLDNKVDFSIGNADLEKIFKEYEKIAYKIIDLKKNGSDIVFFHFVTEIDKSPCIIKRIKGCGCGNEYIAVTPEGDIYPCHQFVGVDKFKMGNITENTFDMNIKECFSTPNIYLNEKCEDCWAKFYCGGGCSANNWNFNKDIKKPYSISCELQKKRTECAVMINCALYS